MKTPTAANLDDLRTAYHHAAARAARPDASAADHAAWLAAQGAFYGAGGRDAANGLPFETYVEERSYGFSSDEDFARGT